MLFAVRFILTLLILLALLAAGVVAVTHSAWGLDPLQPAAVLVAPDVVYPTGRHAYSYLNIVALQESAEVRWQPVTARLPDGRRVTKSTTNKWWMAVDLDATDEPGVRQVEYRLSAESGLGALRRFGRVFVVRPDLPAVAVDLEGVRRSGRYELEGRRDWLVRQLDGRLPIYLAEVGLADYNRTQAALQEAGLPDGPLLMWTRQARGAEIGRARHIKALAGSVGLELAVLSELPDNQSAFRQSAGQVQVIGWPSD